MSSAGQVIGGVVGGVIGFFAGGNVMLGASIGMALGGYIDPPKGPKGRPPSASDLAVQTATYGAPLGRGYGTYATLGNIFWVEGNKLRYEEVEAEGGKGGGASGPTTYKIYGTFAVGFGEGEIAGFGRIWVGSKLVTAPQSTELSAALATSLVIGSMPGKSSPTSDSATGTITQYLGGASQLPDDRIQADMGAANTPAYRGLHYLVFKDWPMEDVGNSLMGAQVKAEIIHAATTDDAVLIDTQTRALRRTYGTWTLAQNIPGDLYTPFALAEPLSPGVPNMCSISVWEMSFLYGTGKVIIDAPPGSSMFLYRNHSPVNIGALVYASYKYYRNGVYWCDAAATNFEPEIWVLGDGTILGSSFSGGYSQIVRMLADGSVITSNIDTYDHGVARIWVANGIGYMLRDNATVTVFDPTSLVISEVRSFTGAIEGDTSLYLAVWTTTVDEYGRAWAAWGGDYIVRLNETMTGYDVTQHCAHPVDALAVWGGIVYTATTLPTESTTTYRAYRQSVSTPNLAQLADIIEAECVNSGLLDASDLDVTDIDQGVRGYKISTIAAIRMALEPLQAAWPFDVVPSGYKIKFVRRGKSPVATIDISELACVAGSEKPGVRITASREMDSQLPRKVLITYLDAGREYDLNTGPGAERLNTDAVNVLQPELPIVLSASEAAQIEEVLLYMYWLERHDVSFVLPPTRWNLEAADVITINGDAATYELRLTQINYLPDGRLECQAKFNNVATYTSTAVGQDAYYTGQTLSVTGPTDAVFLDIPVLLDTMDGPGFSVAASGKLPTWNGATLIRSDDSGQTWTTLQGFTTPGAVFGAAVNALPTGRTDLKDVTNALTIFLDSGALASTTEAGMFNGANHFAVGANGRWEIIAAQSCVQNADGSWVLTTLLRGRFGTEWAMTTHAIGDRVVYLDSTRLHFIGANINTIGQARTYRAVTSGKGIDSAADIPFTYAGQNLECLSPVYASGTRALATKDWTVTWIRRTRVGGELRDNVDATLGETSEAYEVEIYSSSAFTTLKRTVTGLTSPTFTYTSAQQVTDFGANQIELYLKIYQVSSVVGRGQPLTKTLTYTFNPAEDPIYNYVTSLLYMRGANDGTTFTDQKSNSWTRTVAVTKTTINDPWGNNVGVGYFSGSGYLTLPSSDTCNPLTNDACLEYWIYPTASGSAMRPYGIADAAGANNRISGYIDASMMPQANTKTGAPYGVTSAVALPLNTWTHVAHVWRNGTMYLFTGGVSRGTPVAYGESIPSSTDGFSIGQMGDYGSSKFVGYMSNFRFTKGPVGSGAARYTGNFTPPSMAFPNQ